MISINPIKFEKKTSWDSGCKILTLSAEWVLRQASTDINRITSEIKIFPANMTGE